MLLVALCIGRVLGFSPRCATMRTVYSVTKPTKNVKMPLLSWPLDASDDLTTLSVNSMLWISDATSNDADQVVGLSKGTAIAVFIVGLIPFGIATVEFWRRIAVRASFGTADPVVFSIGENDAQASSRGKQVLGKDALVTAYIIFAIVAAVLGIVLFSVLTSPDQV